MLPRVRRFAGTLALSALLAAALAPPASALGADGLLSILVMGDSYSAGNGAGDYAGARHCRQSAHNYGRTLATILAAPPYGQPTFVQTVACSGDVAAAFENPQDGRPPQLSAIRRSDDLILLTIGGNDLGFSAIVRYCLVHHFRVATACDARLTSALQMVADGTMERRLRGVLAAIAARADPAATIVLLGYPYLERDDGYVLRHGHTTYDVGRRLRALEDAGDALEQSVADAIDAKVPQSVLFVATKSAFAGHELTAGSGSNDGRWFVEPWADSRFPSDVWYHPNPLGWQHEAALLASDPRIPKSDWTGVVGGPFGLSGVDRPGLGRR